VVFGQHLAHLIHHRFADAACVDTRHLGTQRA
jgi:hypothetical protein